MVVNGFQSISTFVYLNFEKEEANAQVVIPSSINANDPSLEIITVKRLKSVEKGCVYPYISMSFIRASAPDRNNNNSALGPNDLGGLYECLQTITELPKRPRYPFLKKNKQSNISDDGFLIFAYKTMEDMYNTMFAASWKTWTGARLLCKMLPDQFPVKRLSFFKKVGICNGFTYVLMAQLEHLMVDCAPALNVLHYMRPKICAVVGAYRGITFKVDSKMLQILHVTEEDQITGYASKIRILYSNNSVSLEFPDYLEFREEEEMAEQGNLVKCQVPTKVMISEETQTIMKTEEQARRRLPRTISIYDFPSMKDKEESTLSFKTSDLIEDPEINGIIDHVECPQGVWKRRPLRKNGHVFLNDRGCEFLDNNIRRTTLPRRPLTPLPKIQLTLASGSVTPASEVPSETVHSNAVDVPLENGILVTRDDTLLSRLTENYFNSPDYPREELFHSF